MIQSNGLLYLIQEAVKDRDNNVPGAAQRLAKLIKRLAQSSPSRLSQPPAKGYKPNQQEQE